MTTLIDTAPPGTDDDRVRDIAAVLRDRAAPVLNADHDRSLAREGVSEMSQRAAGLRMETMLALANAAALANWTLPEINRATKLAVEGINDQRSQRTLATFIGECKHAMHEDVRAHAGDLATLCKQSWDLEEQAEPKHRPCRRAFRRLYHMTIAAFRLAASGTMLHTPQDVQAWAELNNPDVRVEAVAARLTRFREAVRHFAEEFPVDGLRRVGDILDDIDARDLKVARERKLRGARPPHAVDVTTTHRNGGGARRRERGTGPVPELPEDLESVIDNVLSSAA